MDEMQEYIPRSEKNREEQGVKERPKTRYSKFIVALVIVLNVVFTGAVLYVYLRIGNEPKTLIAAWFAFTTGELWLLANIKRAEIKEGENARSDNDDY